LRKLNCILLEATKKEDVASNSQILDQVLSLYYEMIDEMHGKLLFVSQNQKLLNQIEARKAEGNETLHVILNESIEDTSLSYVKAGLSNIERRKALKQYYMFAECNQPYIQKQTLLNFLNSFVASERGMGRITCKGECFGPVVFSEKYVKKIMAAECGSMEEIVKSYEEDCYCYEISNMEELKRYE